MTTARDLIHGAMRLIGVIRKGETPDGDEANDALEALNAMIASWSNESLISYARVRDTHTLTPSVGSYTIGTGATINTARPVQIISAYVSSGGVDYPVTLINDETYDQNISFKTVLSSIPQYLNYSNEYPNGTIRLWPVPSSAFVLHLLSEKPIAQFATLDTDVELPTGWERALRYSLALEISPEYAAEASPAVIATARESKGLIMMAAAKNRPMTALTEESRRRSILTDY